MQVGCACVCVVERKSLLPVPSLGISHADTCFLPPRRFENRDTLVPEYGPNGRGCSNGIAVDGDEMNQQFTCNCDATKFTGSNCEMENEVEDNDTTGSILVILAVLVVAIVAIVLLLRFQRYQRSMMATDFNAQLAVMKERGEVDEGQALKGGIPRELKRDWLALIDKLGHGAFGDVWKGLLNDGDNSSIPEYMVACKVVKEATGNLEKAGFAAAEEDLLKEALLMAQVESHKNLVALVGVITRGNPKILILSFCEHGEMQGSLKKRAADGDAFDTAAKFVFCKEIAAGMAHLSRHSFVHRDLAARNVLLGSGMVCKVADFGLSRRVQTEDNTGDYYRSSSGIIPVRWTAPEGMTSQKFSTASDVWSFGITCVEIFQDGGFPYPNITSNPEIIKMVCTQGQVHPRPRGCSAHVYTELVKCWSSEPAQRPAFAALETFFEAASAKAGDSLYIAGDAAGDYENVCDTSVSLDSNGAYNLTADEEPQAYNLTADETLEACNLGIGEDATMSATWCQELRFEMCFAPKH